MSIYETSHENSISIERRGKYRQITSLVASTALLGAVLGGCSSKEDTSPQPPDMPERNAPTSAPFSLDTNEAYFNDVASMQDYTDDPQTREHLDILMDVPVAEWLFDSSEKTKTSLNSALEKSQQAGTIPLFVAYNIPGRDVGGYSTGGTESATDYSEWVSTISQTIDDQPAVVVLEPDALPHLPELGDAAADERTTLLADALDTFHDNEQTAVYLDAGNSGWLPPDEMAQLLKKVAAKTKHGLSGISLNVANFVSADDTAAYAQAIQQAYGDDLYVLIDSSRNGAPEAIPTGAWCNPEGQRLGEIDPDFTSDAAVEQAFIKTPGQSDGECGIGSKPAGEFDGELLFHQLGDR